MYRLGVDIGSKTIKVVLHDENGDLVYANYDRHYSKVQEKLLHAVHTCRWKKGDHEVSVTVTGSAGMRVAELFDVPFVQEVVALKRAVQQYVPQADAILEMGGEDTKLVYLTGMPEQRMNTICAGGTGGFIDTMAGLMGKSCEDMERFACGGLARYRIASRCAVFAKSDVRPLVNAGARNEDIAASVLEAVCTQAIAGLSAGRPIEGTVVLLGGPFYYIPSMRWAFCRVSGIDRDHAIVPQNAHLFVARGAALVAESSAPMMLSDFEALVEAAAFFNDEGMATLPRLFDTPRDYAAFRQRHGACRIPRVSLLESSENLFLGIDAGSTTMKMALVDESGALCAYEYDWNEGDASVSFSWMLESMYAQISGVAPLKRAIRRSLIVGYGEQFCKAAYGVDEGEVETVAHLRAATALEPDVDFLIDIGGQDIKCFYVKDGVIDDIVLNEACSSGCGSLFDDVARSLRMTKEAFADIAVTSAAPVDLGTRCSVFMDSRVKHAQKEGAGHADIAAGIAYATARNALYKVVRQPDFKKVGKHVVVQGGAFANDALLRAFELETGVEAKRPDLAQLMGAWGAALLARDHWMTQRDAADPKADAPSTLIDRARLAVMEVKRTTTRCDLCTNACKLTVARFIEGDVERAYVTGNRCERGARAFGVTQHKKPAPPNMVGLKNTLLDKYSFGPQPEDGPRIGIPRALGLYESLPFWKRFFNELGCTVVSTARSDTSVFRAGMGYVPAEGACYPAKLAIGHAACVLKQGVDAVFIPVAGLSAMRELLLGAELDPQARVCPLIERFADIARENIGEPLWADTALIAPDLMAVTEFSQLAAVLQAELARAGLAFDETRVRVALSAAQEVHRRLFAELSQANKRVLELIDAGACPGALVSGHPYHADPGIGHGIDALLDELGYAVIETADYDFAARGQSAKPTWESARDVDSAARACETHPHLQLIIARSFGCGVDALSADRVHAQLRSQGRIYAELKLDQIVDLAAVRIRLRSLAYANRQREGKIVTQKVALPDKVEVREDKRLLSMPAWPDAPGSPAKKQADTPRRRHGMRTAKPANDARAMSRKRAVRLAERMKDAGYELFFDGGDDQQNQFMACTFLCKLMFIGPNGEMKNFYTWEQVERFLDKL